MTTQVDFDYNGPPVNVSNGMALQLVSQFGVRNAWFAFLKLRGMKLSNEEAECAQQSFVYFRNKIGHLRREATELNSAESATDIKAEKMDTLMNADFDTFLTTADSLELRSDAPTYAEVDEKELLFNNAAELLNENQNGTAPPTTASLLQVIEQSKSIKRQKCQLGQEIGEEQHEGTNKNNNGPDKSEQEKQQHKKDQNDDKQQQQEQSEEQQTLTIVDNPTGNEGNAAESNSQQTITIGDLIKKQTTSANEPPLPPTAKTQKPAGKSSKSKGVTTEKDDAETKQVVEKLLAAKEEIAKRHAETIDDVVSLVMEKIRNNQPFEGELAVGTVSHTGPGPSKSHHHHKKAAPATNTSGQKQAAPKGGASHKKKGGGATQPIDESQLQPGVFGTAEILQRQQAQQMTINTNASISSGLSAGAPIMATAPAGTFGHFPPGQSIVLLHNPVSGTVELPAYSVAQAATTSSSKLHGGQQQQHYQVYPSHHLQPFPQPSTDQMTILSNYPNFIHSSNTLTTTTTTSKMGTSGIYSQQQQHIGQVMEHQNGMPLLQCQNAAGVAMPVEMAIQQNMTVQELIQTLKSQSRHQNTQIILHHPPNANLAPQPQATSNSNRSQLPHNRQQHLQQQQETPDSSSQEASMLEAQKQAEIKGGNNIAISASALPKKGRKRKLATTGEQATFTGAAPLVATHQSSPTKQQKTQQKSAQKNESLDATVKEIATIIEKKEEPIMENIAAKKSAKSKKGKQVEKETATGRASSSDAKPDILPAELKQQQERIDDLESQLRKVNKQLTTEHNKFSGQKKRIEKLQAELDKTLDSIQLLQIDLACQKTDNNNLIAENIALKAENQQLRSKGQRAAAAAPSSSTIAPISAQTDSAVESNNIIGGYRGRKKKANESAEEQTTKMVKSGRGKKIVTPISIEEKSSLLPLPERTQTPPPLSMELGRRQSKRICVARNQFMKNLF